MVYFYLFFVGVPSLVQHDVLRFVRAKVASKQHAILSHAALQTWYIHTHTHQSWPIKSIIQVISHNSNFFFMIDRLLLVVMVH